MPPAQCKSSYASPIQIIFFHSHKIPFLLYNEDGICQMIFTSTLISFFWTILQRPEHVKLNLRSASLKLNVHSWKQSIYYCHVCQLKPSLYWPGIFHVTIVSKHSLARQLGRT